MLLGSLSTRIFETRTATGREHFECQESGVSIIFILIIFKGKTILSSVNVFVGRHVKRGNSPLPVAVCRQKRQCLKGHRQPVSFARLCCCYHPGNPLNSWFSTSSREEELLRIRCSICFLIQTPSSFRSIILRLK